MALPINQDRLHARNAFLVFQAESLSLACCSAHVAGLHWQLSARPMATKGLFTPGPTADKAKRRQYAILFLICLSEL